MMPSDTYYSPERVARRAERNALVRRMAAERIAGEIIQDESLGTWEERMTEAVLAGMEWAR